MRVLQYSVRVPWRLSAARCPSNHRGAGRTREGHQRASEHIHEIKPERGGIEGAAGGQAEVTQPG